MRSHKLVAHVADVRLKVEGDSLDELFRAALEGMANLTREEACDGAYTLKEKITLSASDITILLIDFLSEVLTLQHINRAVYCKVEFNKLSETGLEATIYGLNVDFFDEDVKAVTYHEADVVKDSKGNYICMIVFDI